VSISLKNECKKNGTFFLRAPTDFVPHKKLDASKFGPVAILWKTCRYHLDLLFEVQPLPEALGPGPWKCHAVVRHLLSNLELAHFCFGSLFQGPWNENELYFIFPRCLFPVDCKWLRQTTSLSTSLLAESFATLDLCVQDLCFHSPGKWGNEGYGFTSCVLWKGASIPKWPRYSDW